jgi:putative transposase
MPNASTGRLRDECLNESWFVSLPDAQHTIEAWPLDYNEIRPHSSLANQSPAHFRARGDFTPALSQLQNV